MSFADHKMKISVWGSNVCINFGFNTYDLLISSNNNFCPLAFSLPNFKDEIVTGIEKLEPIQVDPLPAVYLHLPYFFVSLWHHVFLHQSMTFLHSAHAIAQNKIEFRLPTVVFKSWKQHALSFACVFVLYSLVWELELLVMIPLFVAHFFWQPYNRFTPHYSDPLGNEWLVETIVY